MEELRSVAGPTGGGIEMKAEDGGVEKGGGAGFVGRQGGERAELGVLGRGKDRRGLWREMV